MKLLGTCLLVVLVVVSAYGSAPWTQVNAEEGARIWGARCTGSGSTIMGCYTASCAVDGNSEVSGPAPVGTGNNRTQQVPCPCATGSSIELVVAGTCSPT